MRTALIWDSHLFASSCVLGLWKVNKQKVTSCKDVLCCFSVAVNSLITLLTFLHYIVS